MIHIRNRLAGFFTFHKGKVDADGLPIPGTHVQVASFPNLITDNGLDSIFDCPTGTFGNRYLVPLCFVGTGNTTPAFTDTTLDAYLATSGANESDVTSFTDHVTDPYWSFVKTYRFTAGTATGNIAEVGAGWATNDLFSRALILDGGGSPTTITVLADEYLDVTYEVRNYIDVADGSATISISGDPYDIDYRPALIGTPPAVSRAIQGSTGQMQVATTQTLGTVYTEPAGMGVSGTIENGTYATYVSGNYYADLTCTFGLNSGNVGSGGIGTILFITAQCRFQIAFDPKIPKTNTDILTLTFRVTWARYP